MKFTINKNQFLKHLLDVQRAISSKSAIAILTGIKLNVTKDGIYLTGSDANISIEKMVLSKDEENGLTIHETGKLVLPSRFFIEIIKKLPNDTVDITLLDHQKLQIKSGQSTFNINGLDADLYPIIENIESDTSNTIQLPTFLFKTVLSQTMIAASTSEQRPILTGIHLEIKNGELIATATDSHRMSKRIVKLPNISENVSHDCVIPAKSLSELTKIISDDDQLTMVLSENKVLFISENLYFYSRLLEGNYPDVTRLLSQEMTTHITIDANAFLHAVERVSILSTEGKNDIVTLDSTASENIKLYTESSEIGYVEDVLLPTAFKGNGLKIAFNPNYMKDALRVLSGHDVIIGLMDEGRPFTLKASDDELNQFIQLITPIRTRN
ncbi:DNA polymerase III subunit beta [Carnobacteriaceae bacterium zg-C25]|nr:DNA polymerase III subunit beta [Carnobacteriaceae bacterium zg-C25]